MTKKPERAQSDHDEAVRLIGRQDFDLDGLDVYINVGEQRTYGLSGSWPDIVVIRDRVIWNDEVKWIAEVETADSVTEAETEKWRAYAGLRIPFVLYVPSTRCEVVKKLCAKHRIGLADLRSYTIAQGTLTTESCLNRSAT